MPTCCSPPLVPAEHPQPDRRPASLSRAPGPSHTAHACPACQTKHRIIAVNHRCQRPYRRWRRTPPGREVAAALQRAVPPPPPMRNHPGAAPRPGRSVRGRAEDGERGTWPHAVRGCRCTPAQTQMSAATAVSDPATSRHNDAAANAATNTPCGLRISSQRRRRELRHRVRRLRSTSPSFPSAASISERIRCSRPKARLPGPLVSGPPALDGPRRPGRPCGLIDRRPGGGGRRLYAGPHRWPDREALADRLLGWSDSCDGAQGACGGLGVGAGDGQAGVGRGVT